MEKLVFAPGKRRDQISAERRTVLSQALYLLETAHEADYEGTKDRSQTKTKPIGYRTTAKEPFDREDKNLIQNSAGRTHVHISTSSELKCRIQYVAGATKRSRVA
jgi:hypothetical protein